MVKKIKKYIPRIILLDTIIYILIIGVLHSILSCFGLMFRQWVYIISILAIAIGLIVGIIQLILKIKKKGIKISLISIFIILLLLSSRIFLLGVAFGYKPEHVVEKDGKKYVAYVDGFLRTYVYYYDYKNLIVVGKEIRIQEDYGRGGFDPIENEFGYEYEPKRIIYYDEKGEAISIDEMEDY